MKYDLPMKDSKNCTEQFNFRCEKELKDLARKLSYLGVDVAKLVRVAAKEALQKADQAIDFKAV